MSRQAPDEPLEEPPDEPREARKAQARLVEARERSQAPAVADAEAYWRFVGLVAAVDPRCVVVWKGENSHAGKPFWSVVVKNSGGRSTYNGDSPEKALAAAETIYRRLLENHLKLVTRELEEGRTHERRMLAQLADTQKCLEGQQKENDRLAAVCEGYARTLEKYK